MDLKLNDRQLMFKETTARFVSANAPYHLSTQWFRDRKTFHPDIYAKAAELGLLAMFVPEVYGGLEAPFTDCAVVMEEIGRAPLPGPFFSSGVFAAMMLLQSGDEKKKQTWLPAICSAEAIIVPAITEKGVRIDFSDVETKLTRTKGGFALEGTKRFVYDAEAATHFLCAARDDTGTIRLVLVARDAKGVSVTHQQGFMVSVASVALNGVKVSESSIVSGDISGQTIVTAALERSLPLLAAYKVGACQEIFDFTNEYTRTRVVFGQPIGRFQRVQDHCIELSIHLDAARWITYETLWKLDSGRPFAADAFKSKAVASEAYLQVCNYSHMTHAGPGTDYGHPLMSHSLMSHTLYQYLGTPLHNKRRMMDLLYPRNLPATAV